MSHYESRLNRRFGAQKNCTSCPNWGEGGSNLDKIQKTITFFFVKPSLSSAIQKVTIFETPFLRSAGEIFQSFTILVEWSILEDNVSHCKKLIHAQRECIR